MSPTQRQPACEKCGEITMALAPDRDGRELCRLCFFGIARRRGVAR